MIEDYEHHLAPPPERSNWLQRLLAPFRSPRLEVAPTNPHLRRDIGLDERPIGHRLG